MRRLAQQSFRKVLAIAISWPLLLCLIGAALVFVLGLSGMLLSVSATGPFMAILLFGPPLMLLLAWAIARRRSGLPPDEES